MSLNFGPLNQDGGERRLNVLITRAREKCIVFSNFKAYDMHLTANPPYGVKALKEFLSYAENLTLGTSQVTQEASEPFEDAIASFLVENGYEVDKQIGCAGFRVDLAIVDDENPGKYILGITTDGKMYSSSKVARDRDRLREQVLKGLGWKLYHLWSTDWYRNRDLGRKKLLEAVEAAIKETRAEEKRKSEEAKKLAEKRKKEAEKLAEELRLAKQKELEEQENEESTPNIGENENIEVIAPEDDLDIDENQENSSSEFVEDVIQKEDVVTPKTENISFENEDSPLKEDVSNSGVEKDEFEDSSLDVNSTKNAEFEFKEDDDVISSEDGDSQFREDIVNLDDEVISSGDVDSQFREDIVNSDDEVISSEDDLEFENNSDIEITSSKEDNEELSLNDNEQKPIDSEDNSIEFKEDDVTSIDDDFEFDDVSSPVDDDTEVKEEISQNINDEDIGKTSDNKETSYFDNNTDKKSENKSKDLGFGSIFKSKKKNKQKNTRKIDNIKFSNHIKNEDEFDFKDDVNASKFRDVESDDKTNVDVKLDDDTSKSSENNSSDSKSVDVKLDDDTSKSVDVKSGDKSDKNETIEANTPNSEDIKSDEVTNEKIEFVEDNQDVESKDSSIKRLFFDNERSENKNHGIIASAIIGKSKLEKEEIETVGGEIMENENPKLHRPTPKDEYVVEPEIVDENSHDDELKFKSDVELDDEDIHNMALDIVGDAFEDVITSVNNKKDIEVNAIEDDFNQNYGEEYQDIQQDDDNSQETIDTSTSVNQDNYYQGVSDITNPLKKNNIYHKTSNHKNKSVKASLEDLKNEVKYINKSLKEIENPTPAEYVSVIDRTEDYDPNDYITPEHNDDEEFSFSQDEELTFAEAEEKRYEQEKLMEALKKEIASDDNVIIPIHEEKRRQDRENQALENIIQTANEDYKEVEKKRFEDNNKLKEFDNKKLPGKGKLKDEIVEYKQAENIGLESQEDLFKKSSDEVAKSIDKIVKIEGPVHVDEVIKRVKDSCNIKRAGSNLKKAVNRAIDVSEDAGSIIKIGDFLYDSSNNDVSIRKRHKPNIDLISDEEIAKNIERVLVHKQTISTKSLPKEVSRNFGFKSTSKKTANKINRVLDLMIADNKIKLDDDTIELN